MLKNNKQKFYFGTISVIIIVIILFSFFPINKHNSMEKERENFISLKDKIIEDLIPQGKYRCCLEKPCTYCIEKTPGHGEGAICNCLEDIVNGMHPCGECIGEIMEGHGNPYLAEYFAVAIAEEVGEEHIDTLKQIISEKYGIPVEEQL